MKIRLINFRCYEDKTFDFGDDGLVLISACSGAGKSTILMGIYFALYGVGFKLPMNGKTSCKVEFDYENIHIVRKNGNDKVDLTIDNKEYSGKVAQEIINERFGDTFDVTGYISQDASNSFIKMSPTEKLTFLEKFAFKNIQLSTIKERADSLKKQREKELTKTTTELEISNKVLKELTNPEEVKFPIIGSVKPSLKNYEKITKNEEIRKSNSDKLIKKSKIQLEKLQCELSDLRVLQTHLDTKEDILQDLSNKLEHLTLEENDIFFEGDNTLEEYKKQLQSILTCKKLTILEETYEVDKEKLEKMKDSERDKIKKEIEEITKNLWSEYTENEIIENKNELKDSLKDAKRVSYLQKELQTFNVVNLSDIETMKEKLSTQRDDLDKKRQLIETIIKQKSIYKCPSCKNSLHFRENKLILSCDDIDHSELNTNLNIDSIKKDIEVLQSSIKKLEIKIPELQNNLERSIRIQEEIDNITSQYDELDEHSILEDLDYLESYHKSELAKIKRKNNLENSLNKNIFNMYEVFETDLEKLENRIKKLKNTFTDEIETEFEEEELRKIIINEEKNRDILSKLAKDKSKLESEKIQTEKQLQTNKDFYISKYTTIKSQTELESLIKTEKDKILELEEKKNEHILNLENIKKYNQYTQEKENYIKWETDVKILEQKELDDRRKYTASSLLKEKILEAESISVANIIDSINIHAQIYLDAFFTDSPIIVRLSSFKETKKATKPQINLEIQYKEMECDLRSLSGGESSRVILAFTLALAEMFNTPFILLDESTANLNQELTITVFDAIKEHFKGKMVLIVAHQVVKGVFDNVIELN